MEMTLPFCMKMIYIQLSVWLDVLSLNRGIPFQCIKKIYVQNMQLSA